MRKFINLGVNWYIITFSLTINDMIKSSKSGKCPKSGCIKKVGSDWRVVSNRTGKLWPAKYKSRDSAKKALAAYHMH